MKGSFIYTAEGHLNTKLQRQKDIAKQNLKNENSGIFAGKPFPSVQEQYRKNSTKEELCLEYVASYSEQFMKIYKNRREPFIIAENEFGVKKLVCSTIRPTLLAIPELYDLYECASFIAGYILYEPLDPPTEPPKYLFSPALTLDTNTGDSFDLSVLLCSFLLGAGFDAYVVVGYAPKFITLKDQSMTPCPLLRDNTESSPQQQKDQHANTASSEESSNYIPPDNTVKNSKYLADVAEKKRIAAIDTFQLWVPDPPLDEKKMMDEERKKNASERRVHAWVLVRQGRKDVKEPVFIESSTGRIYPVKNSPYIAIESVFNHLNFYANIKLGDSVAEMSFDFHFEEQWEPLFLSRKEKSKTDNEQQSENDGDDLMNADDRPETENKDKQDEVSLRYFDAPVRWSLPLNLPRTRFLLRYPPHGKRTVKYYCAKADFFARGVNAQSMVMRITLYLDQACTIVKEIHEWFENRADRMYKRIRYFLNNRRFVEFFQPGSKGEVKKWTEYPGKSIEVDYYVNGRLDRLLRREEVIGQSINEHFQGRTDHMTFRSIMLTAERGALNSRQFELPPTHLGPQLYIIRMTQCFDKDSTVPDGAAIAKRVFYVREGKAVFYYHFGKMQVTGKVRTFLHTRGSTIPVLSEQALAQEVGLDEDVEALLEAASLERECFSSIKNSFQQHDKLMESRLEGELKVEHEKTVFEKALDSVDQQLVSNNRSNQNLASDLKGSDYLTPFLRYVADPNNLTKDEALAVRQACLDAMKARLVERANIIQSRLHEENALLGKRQEQFQRQQRDGGDNGDGENSTEKYEEFCTKTMFRIQILEQRLSTHEEDALKKFSDLDLKLTNDPRLRVLRS